jgi:predicted 3-demethylubiquinone-9 3-methyltransferase (glyoxalase superfamily)
MQRITPFLWFTDQAEQAMNFYVSVFKNARVIGVTHYGDEGAGPKGKVMTANFELDGQPFIALNGGPQFKFNPAVSFVINCDTQEEIDYYWGKLTDGGKEVQCGWLEDRYGLSWQVVPAVLPKLLMGDSEKASRVMKALMPMKKLEIAALQAAYDGQ